MIVLHSDEAPKAVGPYVQGIIPDSPGVPVYLSGQVGLIPATGKLAEGLEAQTHQVFANIKAVLKEASLGLDAITYVNVLLVDISHFQAVNTIYAQYFPNTQPTRAAYAVNALPLGALIEVVAIAWKKLP
ncbi:MAG TPA: Rid family detoxifying hydrolase [Luteibaculaceae bacterium]|nr:Rid family detoxifying hydrolase [Luteibaculaceae bacterium]